MEIELLVECYHIFRKNVKYSDTDVLKALIAYYYIIQVLEYYVPSFVDMPKYLKVVDLELTHYYTLRLNNGEEYHAPDRPEPYIRVHLENGEYGYIDKSNRREMYVYEDKQFKHKMPYGEGEMICFDDFHSAKSKELLESFVLNNNMWASKIRKLVLNMNSVEYDSNLHREPVPHAPRARSPSRRRTKSKGGKRKRRKTRKMKTI